MQIEISNSSDSLIDEGALLAAISLFETFLIEKVVTSLKIKDLTLQIAFLNEADAKVMNLKFRQKDYATDVLSFQPVEKSSLGELVLCAQVVESQSKQHNLSFQDECVYLIYHGILHLLGFDHEDQDIEAEKMFKIQDEAFEKFLRRDSN